MRHYFLIISPVALLAAGCNNYEPAADMANNQGNETVMAPSPVAAVQGDADYLAKAGAGDLFEIESSRAILSQTDKPAIKDFAKMMIDAHGKSTAKLKAAAASAELKVAPPVLNADQQAKLDNIKSASGAAAVGAYVTAQREAHAAALVLHQDYARTGGANALRIAAAEIAGVVQQHIDALAKLPNS